MNIAFEVVLTCFLYNVGVYLFAVYPLGLPGYRLPVDYMHLSRFFVDLRFRRLGCKKSTGTDCEPIIRISKDGH